MSRTKRGSKPAGYDYFGPRPYSQGAIGKETKVITHRIERRRSKNLVQKELSEL